MLETQNLGKSFKSFRKKAGISGTLKSFFIRDYTINEAVKDFSFGVKQGEFVGLLGPNGAGKTTLMKMLTGIIVPSSGEISVLGYTPHERRKEFRKRIALVMGQKSQLWWDIPAMDSLLLLQKYYEIPEADFKDRVNELSELLDVKHKLEIHVRKLSLGERMKLEVMASLLHRPDVVFLDEPTIGLDLIAQNNIREFLKSYHKEHDSTVILTSHYMADVDALCERVVLILGGCKRFDGPIQDFANILGKEKFVSFIFSEPINNSVDFWSQQDAEWSTDRKKVDLRIPESELRDLSQKILAQFPVVDFYSEKLPVERVMKSLMINPDLLPSSPSHHE